MILIHSMIFTSGSTVSACTDMTVPMEYGERRYMVYEDTPDLKLKSTKPRTHKQFVKDMKQHPHSAKRR